MFIKNVERNDRTVQHISRHKIDKQDIDDVLFFNKPYIRKGKRGTYYVFGQTSAGRYIFIVIKTNKGACRIITARGMTGKEKRLYKKWVKK